jgi:hypothetical protein
MLQWRTTLSETKGSRKRMNPIEIDYLITEDGNVINCQEFGIVKVSLNLNKRPKK